MILEGTAMAKVVSQDPVPPTDVFVEFLHALQQTVSPFDRVVPVLRGSILMKRWFGEAARPAGDIDLEWFQQPGWEGRFASPIEHGRSLCMFAVGNHHGSPIGFDPDIPVPSDGVSLWDYDTPGLRCYTGWTWNDRNERGVLQIDIALAGSYDLAGVAPETIELPRKWGAPVRMLAYSPELLLAAKLSWIVRHVQLGTTSEGNGILTFLGEPKDLFDAHLLLTESRLRPEVFQNALLAVAMEDKFEWNQLDLLLDPGHSLPGDDRYPNWSEFSNRHASLALRLPTEMLRTAIGRLRPLMGDVRQHLSFLRWIQADPIDEAKLLIYADWLEERGDPRGEFLRLFCMCFFHENHQAGGIVASSLSAQPGGWLYHVFGGTERSRDIRRRIEAP
jgi:uncharacterized protein (TIGR02996 family)